jgi:hypothetical protein
MKDSVPSFSYLPSLWRSGEERASRQLGRRSALDRTGAAPDARMKALALDGPAAEVEADLGHAAQPSVAL